MGRTTYQIILGGSSRRASRAITAVGRDLAKLRDESNRTAEQYQRLGTTMSRAGRAMTAATAPAAAAVGLATRSFFNFDSAMQQAVATMGDVTDAQREGLVATAREVSRTTLASAQEAAEGYRFLAQAGLDATTAQQAIPVVMEFATAGMLDAKTATDQLTDSLSGLGQASDDPQQYLANLSNLADMLTRQASIANTSIDQLGEAFASGAAPAAQIAGREISEVSALLGVLADQGVKGAEAGQQVLIFYRDLPRAIAQNRDEFGAFADELLDAEGNMREMGVVIDALTRQFAGMSDEQRENALESYGLTRAVNGVIKRLAGFGDTFREYQSAVEDSDGALSKFSETLEDSFSGRVTMLRNELATVGQTVAEDMLPALEGAVGVVEALASAFDLLPEPMQAGLSGMLGLSVAAGVALQGVGLMTSGFATMVGKVQAGSLALDKFRISAAGMSGQLQATAVSARTAAVALGALTAAVTVAAAAYFHFKQEQRESEQRVKALTDSLDGQTAALTENTRAVAAKALQEQGALDTARKLGLSLEVVTDAALGEAEAIAEVQQAVDAYRERINNATSVQDVFGESFAQTERAIDSFEGILAGSAAELERARAAWVAFRQALGEPKVYESIGAAIRDLGTESGIAAWTRQVAAAEGAADGLGDAVDEATTSVKTFSDAIRAQADPVFAVERATIALARSQQAYTDAQAQGSEADQRAAYLDLVEATLDLSSAHDQLNGTMVEVDEQGRIVGQVLAESVGGGANVAGDAYGRFGDMAAAASQTAAEGANVAAATVGTAATSIDEVVRLMFYRLQGYSQAAARGLEAWGARYSRLAEQFGVDIPDVNPLDDLLSDTLSGGPTTLPSVTVPDLDVGSGGGGGGGGGGSEQVTNQIEVNVAGDVVDPNALAVKVVNELRWAQV